MTKAGPVYGSFATVAGMFALLYLVGQALVYAAEIAAVRYARLWPRALDLNRPTEADARAIARVCVSLAAPVGAVLEGGYALGALGRAGGALLVLHLCIWLLQRGCVLLRVP